MIKLSFKNPYLVLVFAIIVVVLSAVLIPRMPVDILPQFKKSAMQIITLYPGMPAEVVEKDITSRMERWTGQSPGIEKQLSKSIMGVSIVTVIILLTPIINITRMESASGFLNTFLVAQMGVVLGFMGATALSKTKMK